MVGAIFRLGNCFDLLDPGNVALLLAFKDRLVTDLTEAGQPTPKNHRKHKKLDCVVFNHMGMVTAGEGRPVESFRAVYVPANRYARVWNGSWINVESHIQISVTNLDNILAVWSVKAGGRYDVDP